MESNENHLDRQMLKQVIKEAVAETLHEKRDFLYDVIAHVMQDLAFSEAIDEGRKTDLVRRKDIFDIVESAL